MCLYCTSRQLIACDAFQEDDATQKTVKTMEVSRFIVIKLNSVAISSATMLLALVLQQLR